ncbi:hypothetical protein ACFVUN_01710 [Kitasatospora griseola]|uniref:hypothetical protein n=1 Tax=Kitasatospora griseola TaxID=2064 RepID=UPI0036D8625F
MNERPDIASHELRPSPVPPDATGFRVEVTNNAGSQIIVAAGPVTLASKPHLPVTDIPAAELGAVQLAWVDQALDGSSVSTASETVALLGSESGVLAVIAGPAGFGKRTAAIRALWEHSRLMEADGAKPLTLREITPDWEDPQSPDASALPFEADTGYLIDVAAEMASWPQPSAVAQQLLSHAERLEKIGSFLVVVASEHGWPEGVSGALDRVLVRAKSRPSASQIARKHLEFVYHKGERVRSLRSSAFDGGLDGVASHLLTGDSRPGDAARLAALLADSDGSPDGLRTAVSTFQEWKHEVQQVFRKTEGSPDDRALLVAGVFLNGSDVLSVQDGARELLREPRESDVRTILTGPDLTTRLESVDAKVTGRTVSFDHRPGYVHAVLVHLWHQRADIHPHLLTWLDTITAPKRPGAARLAAISNLLVDLAVAENDISIIERIHCWIDSGHDSPEHRDLIARVLSKAAEADPLGAAVRARLLDWAREKNSVAVATVVALVCRGDFAAHYPRQALVRLRHVLDRAETDSAVLAAQEALRDIAGRDGQLPRVWNTVVKWVTEHGHLAGHRAFLSLLDPSVDPHVLQVLLSAAEQQREIRTALVTGWNAALSDPRVVTECQDLLASWARARKSGQVPGDLVKEILEEVVARHLYSTPVSALIFGEPGVVNDEAVVELRKELRLFSALSDVPGFEPSER